MKATREVGEKILSEMKRVGLAPNDTEYFDVFKDEHIGKMVMIEGKLTEMKIKLTPPVFLEMEEGPDDIGQYHPWLDFKINEIEYYIHKGYLHKKLGELKDQYKHTDEFNIAIAILNIIGLPFDFISPSDIIFEIEDKESKKISAVFSEKAEIKYQNVLPITINLEKRMKIFAFIYIYNNLIMEKKINKIMDVFIFFGQSTYFKFHSNNLLSFINGWIFIEAMIDNIWRGVIIEKNKEILDKERDWTTSIKIEELYLLEIIDKEARDNLNKLRKKRNALFHLDKKRPEKRKILKNDVQLIFKYCWKLLNKIFEIDEDGIYFLSELNEEFYKNLHKKVGRD